ncbi:MAG: peroxide stress protein YaaA [Bacteroidota bacterium]|nr:peroxide stress protein YaaA [Bacteroidota bacterium]
MKIFISPAKKINEEKILYDNSKTSKFYFQKEVDYLINELKEYSVSEIKKLMNLSDNLSHLNFDRFQNWNLKSDKVCPSIYMFQGDVYKGLKATSFNNDQLDFAQQNLRIISGLYGLLKPLDLIYPYRLEMGTKMITNKGKNLYEFWGNKLRDFLTDEISNDEIIINLASNEYSKSLKLKTINNQVITPVFKDFKNGRLKVISFFAKRARGEMANFIISNKITNCNDLKLFNYEGYKYSESSNHEIVFTR